MPAFRLWHFAAFLIRVIAWYLWHCAVVTFRLVHDVSTELSERLLIVSIWSAFAVFSDDAVFGYSSYCGNHTETHLRCYILHFKQRIIVGTVAEDGYHNTSCAIGLNHPQTFHSQCRHTSCKDWHGNDRQVVLMDVGQLDASCLDAQVCHNALFTHALA